MKATKQATKESAVKRAAKASAAKRAAKASAAKRAAKKSADTKTANETDTDAKPPDPKPDVTVDPKLFQFAVESTELDWSEPSSGAWGRPYWPRRKQSRVVEIVDSIILLCPQNCNATVM